MLGAIADAAKKYLNMPHVADALVRGGIKHDHISTSYIEPANLTMRMGMRRFTRLTNGFSKKIENHTAATARHMMHYKFVRVHQTLRIAPAMTANVTNRLWEVSDFVALLEPQNVG